MAAGYQLPTHHGPYSKGPGERSEVQLEQVSTGGSSDHHHQDAASKPLLMGLPLSHNPWSPVADEKAGMQVDDGGGGSPPIKHLSSAWVQRGKRTSAVLLALMLVALAALIIATAIERRHEAASARAAREAVQHVIHQQLIHQVPQGVIIDMQVPPNTGKPLKKQPKPSEAEAEGALPALDPRVNYSRILKPSFHITPPYGAWMNDPNGMMQVPSTHLTHVFYQLNPEAPVWGSPWWGHAVSADLAHWQQLPPALIPDQWYDRDGVFSGSATLLTDGTPFIMFTGVQNFSQYGFYYQMQAAAVPVNASDPLLISWEKLSSNPLSIEIPPGGTHAQFRDPVTAWRVSTNDLAGMLAGMGAADTVAAAQQLWNKSSNTSATAQPHELPGPGAGGGNGSGSTQPAAGLVPGRAGNVPWGIESGKAGAGSGSADGQEDGVGGELWMTAVGSLDDCLGAAALYVSSDQLRSWHYAGSLFSQLALNMTRYSTCLPPPSMRDQPPDEGDGGDVPSGSKGYGGHCDQFGKDCRMWECPDLFEVAPGITAFKYSDQERGRKPFSADFYVLGETSLINYTAALIQDGKDAYTNLIGGEPYQAQVLDYGAIYASKSWAAADGRRLWLGWVYEESKGCTELCADGTPFIRQVMNWQGAQTLVRVVTYDPEVQALLFNPAPELAALRIPGPPLYEGAFTLAGPADSAQQSNRTQPMEAAASAVVLLPELPPGLPPQATHTQPGSSLSASGRRQLEIPLTFNLTAGARSSTNGSAHAPEQFELGMRLLTGNGTFIRILLNGTAAAAPPPPTNQSTNTSLTPAQQSPVVQSLSVWVDRTRGGGMTQTRTQGGPVRVPHQGLPANNLSLHIFVDRSIIEAYALSGRGVVTSRFYPIPLLPGDAPPSLGDEWLGAWGVEVFGSWAAGSVTVHAQVMELGSCWIDDVKHGG